MTTFQNSKNVKIVAKKLTQLEARLLESLVVGHTAMNVTNSAKA